MSVNLDDIASNGANAVKNGKPQTFFAQGISTSNIINNQRKPLTFTKWL